MPCHAHSPFSLGSQNRAHEDTSMPMKFLLPALPVLLCVTQSQAGPWWGHGAKSCEKETMYSPWHYKAPALYRLHNRNAPAFSGHAVDHYPCVPSAISVVSFPCPAIPPEALYLNTGLPYDPAGPFMSRPAVIAVPATNDGSKSD